MTEFYRLVHSNFLKIGLLLLPFALQALTLQEKQLIGERIWKNECNGTEKGLTSWNKNEPFPSMGIGHFIWYPEKCTSPFEETFPSLIQFLKTKGVIVLLWTEKECPWATREAFYQNFDEKGMTELRSLLASTVPLQTEFIIERFEIAMKKVLGSPRVKKQYDRLMKSPEGVFAMIDYFNFKGSGFSEKERYQGVGWGLLQVLSGMNETASPIDDLVLSAKNTLKRRIELSPPEKDEKRWLAGWMNRIESYRN